MSNYNEFEEALKEDLTLSETAQLEPKLLVDFSEQIEKPPALIKIENDLGHNSEICTLGNFSMIMGKAKTRKSFFLSALISACIQGSCNMRNIAGEDTERKLVLMFDTEMSSYHSQRMGFSVIKQLEQAYRKYYRHYKLRELTPVQRTEFIEDMLMKYQNECVMIVIDGIKDLLSKGINDEAEGIELTTKIMRWTSQYNIHIINVLHQNKNDRNARGHIGTELTNKSETVLSIEKDKRNSDISHVTAEYTRGRDFEPISFILDEDFLPHTTDVKPAMDQKLEEIQNAFELIYKDQNYYMYTSLAKKYATITNLTEATAKNHIKKALVEGILNKNENHYSLNIQKTDSDEDLKIPF